MTTNTTTTPISPLRQRMQHDMMMRGLLPRTQDQYIRHVRRFAAYLGRPPDTATAEDLRSFQIHQHESGASAGTINGAVSALRFLYTVNQRATDPGTHVMIRHGRSYLRIGAVLHRSISKRAPVLATARNVTPCLATEAPNSHWPTSNRRWSHRTSRPSVTPAKPNDTTPRHKSP